MITVSASGDSNYISIQEAVNHAHPGDTILIKPGIYKERVVIKTPGLTLIGSNSDFTDSLIELGIHVNNKSMTDSTNESSIASPYVESDMYFSSQDSSDISTLINPNTYISSDKTIITYGLYGKMPNDDIGKLGTFRTYTMFIDAENITLKNLTIENSAGAGSNIGQAIALYAEGEGLQCIDVRLLGWQDTLFTGPLPPKEIEKNGFIGPKQYSPRINGRQYYKNCYIEGDIDFIFGSATAYFDECVLFQKDRSNLLKRINKSDISLDDAMSAKSYATAASTPEGQEYGYIFNKCYLLSDCPDGSCYLGRPWRNFAQVLFMNSYLGPQICKEGFHNWNKKEAETTVKFMEYNNYGPGAISERASFVTKLSDSDLSYYNKEQVLPFLR